MTATTSDAFASGFAKLMGSQIFLRLATFSMNQIVTKLLSVEAFGLMSIRFHLINTMILMIGREGFRRGCLTARQGSLHQMGTQGLLSLGAISFPLGALAALPVLYCFSANESEIMDYNKAVLLQGLAAIVELASEPLYILSQARMQIGLRVAIEAAATIAKIIGTLILLLSGFVSEALAISLAQVLFAVVILTGYAMHYWPEWRQTRKHTNGTKDKTNGVEHNLHWNRDDLIVCSSFTAQAVEKLALAEGSKIAMTWIQSAYEQGVYGLVVNLGSIAARTLLQPFEEAAFLAFSRPLDPSKPASQKLDRLVPLLKIAILFGSFAVVFGPNNTYPLLHLLYGRKYSQGDAPQALAWYCSYIMLLAVNGILESFVHATAHGKQLAHGHVALVVISVTQTAVTIPLVTFSSTVGMVAADAVGMGLRILYCLWFVVYCYAPSKVSADQCLENEPRAEGPEQQKSARRRGSKPQDSLVRESVQSESNIVSSSLNAAKMSHCFPHKTTGAILCGSFVASALVYALTLRRGCLSRFVGDLGLSLGKALVVHVLGQSVLFLVAALLVYRVEKVLVSDLKGVRQKQL